MKTKIKKLSRRSLSTVLAILMMLSTLMVSTITVNASITGNIYFDNSKTQWSDVYCFIGHSGYLASYRMSLDSNGVWKTNKSFSSEWNDATGVFFASTSGGYKVLSGTSDYNKDTTKATLGITSYTATSSTISATYCYVPASASNGASLTCNKTPATVKSTNGALSLPAVTDTDLENVINSSYVQIFMGQNTGWGDATTYYLFNGHSTATTLASTMGAAFKSTVTNAYVIPAKTAVSAGSAYSYTVSNNSGWGDTAPQPNAALIGGSAYILGSSDPGSTGRCGDYGSNYLYYRRSASASIPTTTKNVEAGNTVSVTATITTGYHSYNNGGNKSQHMVFYAKDSSDNIYKVGESTSNISSASPSTTLSGVALLPAGQYTVYGMMNDDVINVRASNSFTLNVYDPISGGTLSAGSTTVLSGSKTTTITPSGFTGGSGSYTYAYSVSGSGATVTKNANNTATFTSPSTVSSPTSYTVTCTVTDSTYGITGTATISITVVNSISGGSISAASSLVLSGGNTTTITPSGFTGGSGSYTYAYSVSGSGATVTKNANNTATFKAPTSSVTNPATYTITCTATDSTYSITGTATTTVTVVDALSAGLSASSLSMTTAETVNLTPTKAGGSVSGLTGSYTVTGSAGGSVSGNVYTPASAGTATITYTVSDSTYTSLSNATASVTITVTKAATPIVTVSYTGANGAATATSGSVITTNQHNVTAVFSNQADLPNGTAYTWQYTKNGATQSSGSGNTSTSGGSISIKSDKLASGTWVFSVTANGTTSSVTVLVNAAYKIVVPAANTNSSLSTGISNSYYVSAFTDDVTTAISAAGTYYSKSGKGYQVKYSISNSTNYTFNSDGTNNATSTFSGTVTSSGVTITAPTVYERQYTLTMKQSLNGGAATDYSTPSYTVKPVSGTNITAPAVDHYTLSNYTVTSGPVTVNGTSYATNATIPSGSLTAVKASADVTIRANFTDIKYSVTLNDATHTNSTTSDAVGIATSYSVTAASKTGYTFSSWTVTGTGVVFSSGSASTQSITITAQSAVTLTANYTETKYTVSIAAEKCGDTDLGIVSPASGSAGVDTGISATATQVTGYEFVEWTGSNLTFTPNSASTTITSSGGTSAQANFRQTRLYLDVHANDDWSGKDYFKIYFFNASNPYNTGTTDGFVDMTEVPNTTGLYYADIPSGFHNATTNNHGFIFVAKDDNNNDWNGTKVQTVDLDFDGKKNRYTIASDTANNKWETDAYIMETYYDVAVTVGTGGTITYDGNSVSSGGTISVSQNARALVATPDAGYVFSGWTTTGGAKVNGGTSYASASANATATAAGTLTASFTAVSHNINVSGVKCTAAASSASGVVGDTITINITPNKGYEVSTVTATWAVGGGSVTVNGSGNSTRTITIPGYSTASDLNVVVTCTAITPTIGVTYQSGVDPSTKSTATSGSATTTARGTETIAFTNASAYPSGTSFVIKNDAATYKSSTTSETTSYNDTLAAGTYKFKVVATLDGVEITSSTVTLTVNAYYTVQIKSPAYGGRVTYSYTGDYRASGTNTSTPAAGGTKTIYVKAGTTISGAKYENSGDGTLATLYVDGTDQNGTTTAGISSDCTVTADFYANLYEKGDNNSWSESDQYRFKYTDTANVYELKLTYAEASSTAVNFKIYDSSSSAWYTNASFAATTDVTNADFNTQGGTDNNAKFTPNAVGTYTFRFNRATSGSEKLTLEYPKFRLTLGNHTNSTVTGLSTEAASGATVSFTVTPASGYSIAQITLTPTAGGSATSVDNVPSEGGEVSFTMPSADTTVAVIAVHTPTVTPQSATLSKKAKETFDLVYTTANNAVVTSISFAGTDYTSSLASPKSLTVPEDLGIDSPYTGTKTYTITINYRHETYTNITGSATVTLNATYTETQQAYKLLSDLYSKYNNYGITESDTERGYSDYESAMNDAEALLTGLPLPSVNASSTYSTPRTNIQNKYNAIVFKTNTIYALVQNNTGIKVNASNYSSWFTDKNTTNNVGSSSTDFIMTFEGSTSSGNSTKYLYSFTYYGKSDLIVYRNTTANGVLTTTNRLSDTILKEAVYGEYYVDLQNKTPISRTDTVTADDFVDFTLTDNKATREAGTNESDYDNIIDMKEYTLDEMAEYLGLTYSGSLKTSNQTITQSFIINGPYGRNDVLSTEATLSSSQSWTPEHAGKYTFELSANIGTDNRSNAGAIFRANETYTLYVAYDEITVYADMNGNIGTPILHFDYSYTDENSNTITGMLPYEFDLVTGSESVYSAVLSLETLESYGYTDIKTTGIVVDNLYIDTDEFNGFTIRKQALRTGTVWLKANSTNMTGFNQIAYASASRSFKAVFRDGSDTPVTNSFATASGTGVITDELLDNSTETTADDYYSYNVFYAASDGVSTFTYNVKVSADHDISHNGTNYYFDHWEDADGQTETIANLTSGTDININSMPEYNDITYVAVYKPVSTSYRAEITYNFEDFDTSDGNYMFVEDKTTSETYTKTVKVDGEVTTSNAAEIASANAPIIKSNYFDYDFESAEYKSYDAATRKYKIEATFTNTAHRYKIIVNANDSNRVITGYYQQAKSLKASDYGVTSGNYYWCIYEGAIEEANKRVLAVNKDYTAQFVTADGVSAGVQTIYLKTGTATAATDANSAIMYSYSSTYYQNDTQKARHNFYIIDSMTSANGTLVGGGVVYATAEGGSYRQTAAGTTLASTSSITSYINSILNPDDNAATANYAKEYKPQTINNVGFRYLPYTKGADVFRYSEAIGAYIYTFAGDNTNSASLDGQTLRVFSYFIYDNGGTKTVVVSDMYAECERYIAS